MMKTINVLTNKEMIELKDDIQKCLETLYKLEDITDYTEKAISNCIDFLQNLGVEYEKENN